MKTFVKTAILAGLLFAGIVVSSQAADMEHHHPGDEAAMPSNEMHEMMMQRMATMQDKEMLVSKPCMIAGAPCSKACMAEAAPPARHHWLGAGMSGMMGMGHDMMPLQPIMTRQRMDHVFFLDRVEALQLSADQVTRLKALRSECRKDIIGKTAEAQVARLELQDLLDANDWTLNMVEPLVRLVQKLEGDRLVRHLQSVAEARKVLTAEQLQKADSAGDDLEELFQ